MVWTVMALPALQERYRAASSLPGSLILHDMQRFVRALHSAAQAIKMSAAISVKKSVAS